MLAFLPSLMGKDRWDQPWPEAANMAVQYFSEGDVSEPNSLCQRRSHCHEPEAADPATHGRGMESEAVAVYN